MRHVCSLILGISVACIVGCGPKVYEVTGKVTYNQEELKDEGCKIVFFGPEGQEVFTPIAPNGQYKAKGVVMGENKVAIYYSNPNAKPRVSGKLVSTSSSLLQGLPLKYADIKTSELSVNVGPGTVYDVDMKGPPLGEKALDVPLPKLR